MGRNMNIEHLKKLKYVFRQNGFKILSIGKSTANGPDIWIVKNGKPYSVEVKICRLTKRNSVQVPFVEKNRINDDFIAILHPSGYVLFEPMKHHLNNCTSKGYRSLWN
jgi:Holliday junction resolvase